MDKLKFQKNLYQYGKTFVKKELIPKVSMDNFMNETPKFFNICKICYKKEEDHSGKEAAICKKMRSAY